MVNFNDTLRQLELLGKSPATTRLRFIISGQSHKSSFSQSTLESYTAKGFNAYLVVNDGGDKDSDITECLALFCEWDDKPIDWQRTAWQSLGLSEPTFQVATGGKSIHSYWVFDKPCTDIEAWGELQSDFLNHCDADRSIKNPSRVMRLVGGIHQKTGNQSTLEGITGKRYSFDELRAIVPLTIQKVTPKPKPAIIRPAIDPDVLTIDPYKFLSRTKKADVDHGFAKGTAHNGALELSRELAATALTAQMYGVPLAYDPKTLYQQALQGREADSNEYETIWQSRFNGVNPDHSALIAFIERHEKTLCTASNPVNDESSTGNTQPRLTALVTVSDVTDETPFDRVIHLPRITKETLKTLELANVSDLVINVGNDLIANEIKWAIKGFNGLDFHCKKIGGNLRILGSGMTMFFSEYETLCNGQKFTANYRFKLTESDRYLPQDKILEKLNPGQTKLIGIKAPQAAGKTEVSEKIIKVYQHHYTEKTGKFLPVISISLRVTLAEGNSKRLNIPHIDLIVQQGLDWASQGLSIVADSCYLNPKAKKAIFDIDKVNGDCILFLDEVVQLFDHMLFSSTMKNQRVQVLENFTKLLSKVYNSEHGVVIGLDADLNDTTIQTLSKLMSSGEKADLGLKCLTFKATNKWTKPKRSIHLTEKPEELMSILLDTCKTLEKGEKLLVGTASQQLKSTFSAHWIAQKISEEFPGLKVLVLDSATTKNPDSKAFGGVGKINQMIVENDVIVYTPVLSTGVSIDALPIIESVKSVFSFGSQAINPQTQRQSLERLRSYCDVFAFAPKTITPSLLNGATNAWSINQHIIDQNKLNEHDAGIIKACQIADKKHAEFGEGSPWMLHFSEYAAYKNLSQKHYQQLFINALKADGYAVKYLEVGGAKALKKEMQALKEAGLADKYQRIPSDSVECLDLDKYNDLKDAKQLTQADQDALEKFQVSRTYYLEPNELTPTLLREHDEYGSAGALTWCYLKAQVKAPHITKQRDQRKRAQRLERDGVVFLPDSNRELVSAKATILHELDLLGFIDRTKDEQIHKNHPDVTALIDRLKARLKRFNTAFGKRYTVKTLSDPIRVIRELLKSVQHQIVPGVRTMIEGEQTRCYSITQLGSINLRDLYMRWAWFECESQVKHEAYIESLETAQEFEDHAIAFTVDNSPHKVVYRYPA
jgi:hypothetical protein